MSRFADEAFLASLQGLHRQLDALKAVYASDPRKLFALCAAQQAMAKLAAASIGGKPPQAVKIDQ